MGSSPGWGTEIPYAEQQLNPWAATTEPGPQVQNPRASCLPREAPMRRS